MANKCEPLCHFSDRLYLTSFPHPPPAPEELNRPSSSTQTTNRPKIRSRPRAGPSVSPDDDATYYYFTIDNDLPYLSFFQDWGPLNLAMVYKACILIHELLQDEDLKKHRLVLYSSSDPKKKANAALLMALYVMIVERRPPWEAFHPLAEVEFIPFRDAGRGPSDFNLSIQDCIWGIWKAMQHGLCDMNEFSVEDYEYYEKVENGDWNWITPGFIAFASPVDANWIKAQKDKEREKENNNICDMTAPGSPTRGTKSPSSKNLALQRKLPTPYLNCLDYFEKNNIKLVIRLNNKLYDRETFLEHGIDHMELYFDDGTNPTDEIVRTFIDVADRVIEAGGVVAVHCKAGLGRTGTLIGAYLIWKYGFTANEAIAFMRIVRPGSVVGPQQQYMYLKQLEWVKWAAVDEMQRTAAAAKEVETAKEATATPTKVVTPATPPADTDEEMAEAATLTTSNIPIGGTTTPPPARPAPGVIAGGHVPVTPSRHIAAAQAKAREIAPPGQPRKTPRAKRAAEDSDDESGLDMMEGDEGRDTLPALQVAGGAKKGTMAANAATRASKRVAAGRKGGVTASESRPTRLTRSTAVGATRKAGTVVSRPNNIATSTKPTPAASSSSLASPHKIPRLATTRSTAAAKAALAAPQVQAPTTRRAAAAAAAAAGGGRPPASPIPSRLPQLVPSKRPHHTSSMSEVAPKGPLPPSSSGGSQADKDGKAADAWITTNAASSVVVPGNKSERPGLRNVKKRRSSFSAADVVA